MTIEEIMDIQMSAFNNRSIQQMMPLYSDDIKVYNFQDLTLVINGKKECEEMFVNLFKQSPNLNAEIIKSIFFDNKVILHEYVSGRNGDDTKKEQVVIFEITNQKISRMDIMR
ncbi:nuclear transport factor 2 family protein [Flavobacterium sp. UBA7680]|uniref:nuclear transport factor 2 family protein n=1 Tax=Flavobacterium sp. UBA7680 TaxID=1946559 RepID=UPI0025C7147B|nr:nuclear transport factor 2 family protein [Flavobacterium sp. UBA7680]